MVHDEAKDKEFELEMTWIGPQSKLIHSLVPKDIKDEAERLAKVTIGL
jgi:20S proteasome subunit alpha 7